MLAEQRHRLILERLARAGSASVGELTRSLGVSRETVRRDIAMLAARHRLRKTRGGALALGSSEADEAARGLVNAAGKRAIGRRAVLRVPDGASLMIDSGTTTRAVAEALLAKRNLVVYTSDLRIALMLGRHNGNSVVLLGGDLQNHEDATVGWDALATLERYRADFAFVGIGGVAQDGALTDFTRAGAELRAAMLRAARAPIVVADHTKFGRATPVKIAGPGKGVTLIADRAPPPALARVLGHLGYRLEVASAKRG